MTGRMIYTLDTFLEVVKKVIQTNRKRGRISNIIIKDDGRKLRVGERITTHLYSEKVLDG